MFDGSSRVRRTVTLRGNSTRPESREQLKEKARLERLQREDLKRKTKGSLKIQIAWRHSRSKEFARISLYEDLKTKIAQVDTLEKSVPGFHLSGETLQHLIFQWNLIFAPWNESVNEYACWLINRLVALPNVLGDSVVVRFLSTVLRLFETASQPTADAFFSIIRKQSAIAGRLLVPSSAIHRLGRCLVDSLLSIPAGRKGIVISGLCMGLLQELSGTNAKLQFRNPCLSLFSVTPKELDEFNVSICLKQNMTADWWSKCLFLLQDYSGYDVMNIAINVLSYCSLVDENDMLFEIYWNTIGKLLLGLLSNEELFSSPSFNAIIYPFNIQKTFQRALAISSKTVLTVAFTYEIIREHWNSAPSNHQEGRGWDIYSPATMVSSAVAFSAHNELIKPLWGIVLHVYRDFPDMDGLMDGLTFVVACTNVLVPALDDDELFQKQTPFTIPDLSEIALCLKSILYQSIWRDFDSQSPKFPSKVVEKSAELFNQLYHRIGRHKIIQDKEWYFPDIHQNELGVASSSSRHSRRTVDAMELENHSEDSTVSPEFASGRVKKVLRDVPQVVPFEQRLLIFDHFLSQNSLDAMSSWTGPHRIQVKVRRGHEYMDAFKQLKNSDVDLRNRIQISFINKQGLDEAGIDGGGVFKEFLLDFCKQAFEVGLWSVTWDNKLFPSPAAADSKSLQQFKFIGSMVGKAVLSGILLELNFADFFLNSMLRNRNYFHDLQSLDPEIYKNLLQLKKMENPAMLDIFFTAVNGKAEIELVPNGSNIPVTKQNYMEYINRLSSYRLNEQCATQANAFQEGFSGMISGVWIRMFRPQELQRLIAGSERGYDVNDMKVHAVYGNGYHQSQEIIVWFWEVVSEFDDVHKALLLKFVSSCSRPPLQGFGALNPPMTISQVRIETDEERLPTASTCVNMLKLPRYSSKEVLRQKLVYSISSCSGFELS